MVRAPGRQKERAPDGVGIAWPSCWSASLQQEENCGCLRGFLDEQIYGLSDSAKAFAINSVHPIFLWVFHSRRVLDGAASMGFRTTSGCPSGRNFVLLFIATFR